MPCTRPSAVPKGILKKKKMIVKEKRDENEDYMDVDQEEEDIKVKE